MAPKKKQQQQRANSKASSSSSSNSKSQPSGGGGDGDKHAPKLQISAENERRLRRLLLNTDRSAPAPPSAGVGAADQLSRSQRAKLLRSIYDKLSLEGFTGDQIENALSALNESTTFETALDWLCLNIPGHELPLKFSSGVPSSTHDASSIKVISTARKDWVPTPVEEEADNVAPVSVLMKKCHDETTIDLGGFSQAEWIRQYMEQQEEEEEKDWEEVEEEADPSSRAVAIAKEYQQARFEAQLAKQSADKTKQQHFGGIISKLKREMISLGLSSEILESGLPDEYQLAMESHDSTPSSPPRSTALASGGLVEVAELENQTSVDKRHCADLSMEDWEHVAASSDTCAVEKAGERSEKTEDVEVGDLFNEDVSSAGVLPLPPDILKQQRKELPQNMYGSYVGNIDDLWKKGDPGKIPKAILQKLCQTLGWEAPKYNKLSEKEYKLRYAVSILRNASGRGKSRKAGGLTTLQLPDQEEIARSVEDAQNRVAAYALCQLFGDLPLDQMLIEPYCSLVKKWKEDESSTNLEARDNMRRAGFVDSLLDAGTSLLSSSANVVDASSHEELVAASGSYQADANFVADENDKMLLTDAGRDNSESIFLKEQFEKKTKLPRYMEMLKFRASLPIAKLRNELLQLLVQNDVIVVCGETGSGKTTQVPQFILDNMIESGDGAHCNIICTQPRRIAAISVAERVSNERCESLPGSDGSLVGYQVRLESARNERTKLLFCTTGIILRKLAGNKDLSGVTHVIVDEVHERSLLGDFLLIVLKTILNRQSAQGRRKLKVILMSATVDSGLFSRYFGNCPVLTAEGRTHPVLAYFLEDIYEKLEYCLPSDSPATGVMAPTRTKISRGSIDNHRGKKNLVLSSWGDEASLAEDYVNPFYISSSYDAYSDQTRKNLKKLREDIIDYDLLEDLVCYIDEVYPPGAILVFLPGIAEIDSLVDRLTASYRFGGIASDWILPLHSSLASTDQRKAFLSPPKQIRKVIVATDIAETSITIDDVVYVVDSGKHKENHYNPQKKMSTIVEDWISRANAIQRRGRAGRVKPGMCFCLYTRHRFEVLMRPSQVPEIVRMPLTELCLQIKSLSLGDIKSFLREAIEPPREEAISSACDLLYKVGAFEGDQELSPLGYHLAKLPVDVLIGKMMVYGAIFGCLSPVLSIASFLSYKFPFVHPKDEKQNLERAKAALLSDNSDPRTSIKGYGQSDHTLVAVAYDKWAKILIETGAKAANRFCHSFFLSSSVMYMIRDMRVQFGKLLADIGLINLPKSLMTDRKSKDKLNSWFSDMSQPFNVHAHHSSVVKSIVCAGLYPNVAATIEGTASSALGNITAFSSNLSLKEHPIWFDGRREVHIHPSSINHGVKDFRHPFLVYLEKVETSKIFLRDTSIISPYSVLLFGGPITVQHQTGLVIIDGWLKLTAPAQTAVLFKELRLTLHDVLKRLVRKPEMAAITKNEVVNSIIHLLLEEEKDIHSKK